MTKTIKILGTCLALLGASGTALAQDMHAKLKQHVVAHETLDASMARLAVKAAFQRSPQPTQQELLGVIVLMSLREQQQRSGT
jgi:cytochrome c oxidase assembly factor CtaG